MKKDTQKCVSFFFALSLRTSPQAGVAIHYGYAPQHQCKSRKHEGDSHASVRTGSE